MNYYTFRKNQTVENKLFERVVAIAMAALAILASVFPLIVIKDEYAELKTVDNEAIYAEMNNIVDSIFMEGKGLNLQNLPKNVEHYEIESSQDSVEFHFSIPSESEVFSRSMTLEFSKQNEEISRESPYSSREELLKTARFTATWLIVVTFILVFLLLMLLCVIVDRLVRVIAFFIKRGCTRKQTNTEREEELR